MEDDVVRRAMGGDGEAYARLVRRYGGPVYVLCRAFLYRAGARRAQDAEDLVQETVLRGWRDRAALKDPARFGPWLQGIARNVCRNWVKDRENSQEPLPAADLPGAAPGPCDDPLRELADAMERLPADHREALLLRLAGYSHREIADLLGVAPATVNAWLVRGRDLLRRLLRPPEPHDGPGARD
jgi:RNA polymerase sigma-70 factor (ECF subfamily)